MTDAADDVEATVSRLSGLPELLPVPRVAELLGLSPRRVYELVEWGELGIVRTGPRGCRVLRESLFRWLRRGGCGPTVAQVSRKKRRRPAAPMAGEPG